MPSTGRVYSIWKINYYEEVAKSMLIVSYISSLPIAILHQPCLCFKNLLSDLSSNINTKNLNTKHVNQVYLYAF